ncbi:Major Facilitator Superfamily [Rhizoctonia solani]|uniref:Major Facilitator Superfamily n=1 Tax=Rhizoctonia solani TaxID=456999 RepID=A0A8H7IEI4_9AGAM|nr:Major Facilitator Superfamily [Rhizoctonia solani]
MSSELQDPIPSKHSANADIQDGPEFPSPDNEGLVSLPPMDKGFAAWSFVAGGFLIETFVWGFGFTRYGVFQEYFLHNRTFGDASEAELGAIGTVALATQYFEPLFVNMIAMHWPHRVDTAFVVVLAWTVLRKSATREFCNQGQVSHLILLQGIMFGIGGGGLYAPVIIYVKAFRMVLGSERTRRFHYIRRVWAGGACFPVAVNLLLTKLGFRWTLRIWAGFMLVFGALALTFTALVFQLFGLKTRMAQHLRTSLYMTVYTTSLGLSSLNGALVLSVFNFSSIIGQIICGHACDIMPYQYVIIVSGAGAALSAYYSGFRAQSGPHLCVCYCLRKSRWWICVRASVDIAGSEQSVFLNAYGLLTMGKGVAAIVGPLMAAALYHPEEAAVRNTYSGYGFHDVTLFVGSMMVATAAGGVVTKWVKVVNWPRKQLLPSNRLSGEHDELHPRFIGPQPDQTITVVPDRRHAQTTPISLVCCDSTGLHSTATMAEVQDIPLQTLSRRGDHSTGASTVAASRLTSKDDSNTQVASESGQRETNSLPHHEGLSLPPIDKGFAAWSFVAAAFMLETLVWGFGFTYGVFQEYFLHHRTFGDASEAAIGAVGTVSLAIEYFEVLIVILIAQQWPHRVSHLILLQGVLFGIGGGGLYAPVIIYGKLSEWFVARRGLAGAIIFGGSGAGGACFPIAVNYLLTNLGFRWTLRIWAGFMLVFGALALAFTRPRLPVVRPQGSDSPNLWTRIKRQHWSFVKSPLFICMTTTTFIQALAYFPVSLYMAVYTVSLGLPALNGTLVLSVFNLSSIIGQIIFGHVCDIAPYQYVVIASGAGAALSAYLLWGFAHSLGLIFAFVIVFGSISGGFGSVWPAASVDIAGSEQSAVSNVFGLLAMTKGVAAVIGPLIAAELYHPEQSAMRGTYSGYGFKDVTLFVGSMMAATAAGEWLLG